MEMTATTNTRTRITTTSMTRSASSWFHAGFVLVNEPNNLPTDIEGSFILLLFNIGWCLSKFTRPKPHMTKLKYVATYNDGPRPSQQNWRTTTMATRSRTT